MGPVADRVPRASGRRRQDEQPLHRSGMGSKITLMSRGGDVITIHISRRAARVFLIVGAAFLVLGAVVPLVLSSVGGSSSPSVVHGTPVPAPKSSR